MSYDLADGPSSATVHWTMTFERTVRFSLDRPAEPDVILVGDWAQMVRSARAGRDGQSVDPGVTVAGNADVLAEIGPAFDAARSVATIPVEFPEV